MINILIREFELISKKINLNLLCNKHLLITGTNGLIASYLVLFLDYLNQQLNLNIKIYALCRTECKIKRHLKSPQNLHYVIHDLNAPFELDFECDYIIHAASNASPLSFSTDPVGTMKTNLFGTMNLLEFAKKKKSKFIYLSSGEIYGNNIDHAFTEEDFGSINSKIVRSCYPESKRAAETLCMSYNHQYGVKINIARLCYTYGPTITNTNSRADAQFLRNAVMGQDIIMKSHGVQKRSWCYVADAVFALLLIMIKGKDSEVYNIANKKSVLSIKQYARILAKIADVNLKFELPTSTEKFGYSKQADSILDASKLEKLGWSPLFSIQRGLKNTYKIKKEMLS